MVLYNKGTRPKPRGQEGLARGSGSYIKHKGLKISYTEKGEGEKKCNGSRERSKYLETMCAYGNTVCRVNGVSR